MSEIEVGTTNESAPVSEQEQTDDIASALLGGAEVETEAKEAGSSENDADVASALVDGLRSEDPDIVDSLKSQQQLNEEDREEPAGEYYQQQQQPGQQQQQQQQVMSAEFLESKALELKTAVTELENLFQNGQISHEQYEGAIQQAQVVGQQVLQADTLRVRQELLQQQNQRQAFQQQQKSDVSFMESLGVKGQKAQVKAVQDTIDFLKAKGWNDQDIAAVNSRATQKYFYQEMRAAKNLEAHKAKQAIKRRRQKQQRKITNPSPRTNAHGESLGLSAEQKTNAIAALLGGI